MQSEWVHSEEKKKACAGYENHVNGYNVYQDARITPTNEDKSCLAHTPTHTFNQLRILYTAYMLNYSIERTGAGPVWKWLLWLWLNDEFQQLNNFTMGLF